MSLEETARRCKLLEDEYKRMRQTVGSEDLRELHIQLADSALRLQLQRLRDSLFQIGGVFADRICVHIDKILKDDM